MKEKSAWSASHTKEAWRSVIPRHSATLLLFIVLLLPLVTARQAHANPSFEVNIARAVDYLVNRFNPALDLIYESDDTGDHWLRHEFSSFKWRYRQTYWLYSDNLFAAYALEPFRLDIANRIRSALHRYQIPSSGLFEVVIGEPIPTIRNAVDHIIESSSDYVIVARRHDSAIISYGLYADLICYRSLQLFIQDGIREAHRSLRQAISLWNGRGLDDWSYRVVDGFYSNQKLALLLYTSKVLGLRFATYAEMEHHLWSMQLGDGGLASLSNGEGVPIGSSNTETTGLALLIYNDALIRSVRLRVRAFDQSFLGFYTMSFAFLLVTAVSFSPFRRIRSFRLAKN